MGTISWIVIISILGPIIGSFLGVIKKPSDLLIHNMLAFAAGVMLAVSFMELLPESIKLSPTWMVIAGLVIASLIMYLLDITIPHIHSGYCDDGIQNKMEKTATYLLFGLFLHNLPEGMAIGVGAATDLKLSLIIALSIAIQNIPEGICTSAPYYYVTKKRLKSFLISSLTALPILLGFLLTHFILQNINPQITGFIMAATAGFMIYISADELIPTSCHKNSKTWEHSSIFSLIVGVLLIIGLGAI